ncbi:motility associated factor glycosyltransferase family protein [Acanthopleuribacter pedis]|uniref:Motility associated factor glycosyltransferase family protein n=1 Tax=Acanthopleuribacter pedis TaxID=442870 RepID=A0A8J7Q730_9BACT|nr:6-hydroxymethylpterin diphosphokinase MptE-like protein [Acanthopleuribacter pedis]MBO1317974.1 motility associated factor glycosyltransferase family protein [Acanthopleuribacter pedis]
MELLSLNRTALAEYDAPALAVLAGLTPDPGVAIQAARRNGLTLAVDGVYVHSKYDPFKEATQLIQKAAAENQTEEAASHHVHFGFGLGFLAEADAASFAGPILIYEPNPTLLLAALSSRDLTDLWRQRRVFVRTTEKGLRAWVRRHMGAMKQIQLLFSPYHRRVHGKQLAFLLETLKSERNRAGVLRKAEETVYKTFIASTLRSFPWWTRKRGVGLLTDRFLGKPAVIVAAGPSLEQNLPALRAYRDRVLIFALARSVPLLERHGIRPHFLVHTEAKDYLPLIYGCSNLADTVFLLSEQCHQGFYRFPHQLTLTYQNPANLFSQWVVGRYQGLRRNFIPTAGSVATEAFSLATLFGCSPVALIGQDLGSRQGRHYADDGRNRNFVAGEADTRRTKGYFGGQVATYAHYLHFRDWYAEAVVNYRERRPDQRFVNATEGGAAIPGFEQITLRELLATEAAPEPIRFEPPTWLTGEMTEMVADTALQRGLIEEIQAALTAAEATLDGFAADCRHWQNEPPTTNLANLQQAFETLSRFSAAFVRFFEQLPFGRAFLPESFVKAEQAAAELDENDHLAVFGEERDKLIETAAAWRSCIETMAPIVAATRADLDQPIN